MNWKFNIIYRVCFSKNVSPDLSHLHPLAQIEYWGIVANFVKNERKPSSDWAGFVEWWVKENHNECAC